MDQYAIKAFAQEGEDLVIKEIFAYFEKRKIHNGGFYLDIGAYHPEKFSNTNLFYKRNWRGINIDATPNSMRMFDELRPLDINLEYAISDTHQTLEYFLFDEPALNSFDKELSLKRDQDPNDGNIISTKKIETLRLEEILDKHLPKNTEIDFMNIDVEGCDFNVLQSNNWDKYKPKVVLIEILGVNLETITNHPIYKFLVNKEYCFVSKTIRTHFFLRSDIFRKRFPQ